MPHVTFIYPCIGRFPETKYVRSWQMEPLCIAVLSALTPDRWDRTFFDDRLEGINYDLQTDLVAISAETYNAKRAYQIASGYRRRGIPVVMGGFHATFCPDEILEHADAVCIGEAEGVWQDILQDAENGNISGKYHAESHQGLKVTTDRKIFKGKKYLDIRLVETGRGCKFKCDFCSITAFHNAVYRRRPVAEVIKELKELDCRTVFFVDDNIIADFSEAKELFRAMEPLKIRWVSQASVNIAKDRELLDLMVKAGCIGVLVGFESLEEKNLCLMNKSVNNTEGFSEALKTLRHAGVRIYGTFVFGYPHDTETIMEQTLNFAIDEKMFLAAFNHLVPFPGTPLYDKMQKQSLMKEEKWWLSETYRFGQLPFEPASCLNSDDIQQGCMDLRRKFYSFSSIFKRAIDFKSNSRGFESAKTFWLLNLLLKREISQKFGLPLGLTEKDV